MKQWRLWTLALAYGALLGAMGGVLALRDPAAALLWAVTVAMMHLAAAGLMYWQLRRRSAL